MGVILSEALHHLVRGEAKNLNTEQADSSVATLPQNDTVRFFNISFSLRLDC
jgi:hypothetical protein